MLAVCGDTPICELKECWRESTNHGSRPLRDLRSRQPRPPLRRSRHGVLTARSEGYPTVHDGRRSMRVARAGRRQLDGERGRELGAPWWCHCTGSALLASRARTSLPAQDRSSSRERSNTTRPRSASNSGVVSRRSASARSTSCTAADPVTPGSRCATNCSASLARGKLLDRREGDQGQGRSASCRSGLDVVSRAHHHDEFRVASHPRFAVIHEPWVLA
jgi:hypothetical protein